MSRNEYWQARIREEFGVENLEDVPGLADSDTNGIRAFAASLLLVVELFHIHDKVRVDDLENAAYELLTTGPDILTRCSPGQIRLVDDFLLEACSLSWPDDLLNSAREDVFGLALEVAGRRDNMLRACLCSIASMVLRPWPGEPGSDELAVSDAEAGTDHSRFLRIGSVFQQKNDLGARILDFSAEMLPRYALFYLPRILLASALHQVKPHALLARPCMKPNYEGGMLTRAEERVLKEVMAYLDLLGVS